MAQQANIHAQTRSVRGKGAARTLRRAGRVPGVIYGHDRPSEAVTIETLALTRLLGSIRAATTIVDVTVDQRAPVKALIREIQRDPLHPIDILHLDLYEVKADEKVTVSVPVRLTGIPDGVRNFGGVLDQVLYSLEVEVFPADIPDHIDLDVTNLAIGHSLFVREASVPKARILNPPESPVCSVVAPRTEEAPPAAVPGEAEAAAAAAPAEPELIRKPKPEAEGEAEE
ncbi:MAG TPA: 50S ribosomal protein L25 [Gemmatimonadales bacterium]|jgi:large subunit ribosomal protein L25|nr:50S ribosomal protein L25 [Gemmatimonadales bacterium]